MDHRALGREEDRRGNAVLIHQFQSPLGLGNSGVEIRVANSSPLQGLGGLVHRGHQAEGFHVTAQEPRVSSIFVLDELGRAVLKARGQIVLP